MQVKVKKLNEDAMIPKLVTSGSASFDLYVTEDVTVRPLEVIKVDMENEDLVELKKVFSESIMELIANQLPSEEMLQDAVAQIVNQELSTIPKDFLKKPEIVAHSVNVGTGLAFEVPEGYEIEIRGQNGFVFERNVLVINGTIGFGEHGEVRVKVYNFGNETISFSKGAKLAEGIVKKVEIPTFVEVSNR